MHRGPMDPADSARVVAGKGIVGNANQGGKRQVTIVSNKHWGEVTAPLGDIPDPRLRRANLLVSDIDFTDARGKMLKIGSVRVRIYGETRPCEQMEDAVPGLQERDERAVGRRRLRRDPGRRRDPVGDPVELTEIGQPDITNLDLSHHASKFPSS